MSTGTILKEYLREENTWEGREPVAAPDHSIRVVVVATSVGAAAHAHHPPRLGHLRKFMLFHFLFSLNTFLREFTWSYTFLKAGAILLVRVPATMITSACLGDARNTMPYLRWKVMCHLTQDV